FCISPAIAEITITNQTAQSINYRIRFPEKKWSVPYELLPSQKARFATTKNLEIKLEGKNDEQTWNLMADKSYEYANMVNQSKADFYPSPELNPVAVDLKSYTTPDQPRVEFPAREFKIL